jgi:ubiquinone/menaquinone biosynthesis C-methylase UbiE
MPQAADPFRITDQLEIEALMAVAARLETRGHHPNFVKPLSNYLDRMDIDRRERVLDLGCGTGIAARAIAQRPGFAGQVLGIDLSEHFVTTARRLATEEGLQDRIRFESGDSHALSLAPASFDAVVAHTLLSHVSDPVKVLAEMRRVLRPGGVIGIFDGDYASMTFELDDPERSKRMEEGIVNSLVTNPRILRQMPRLLKQAGLILGAVMPTNIVEAGGADFWRDAVEAYAKIAPRAGLLSEAEVTEWRDELLAAGRRGVFFGSCLYYAYIAYAA